tara:strand:- start:2176 stop:2550 length:375 start_codon:yes stop_codon:yes gene_type:complete
MVGNEQTEHNKRNVLEALEKSFGIVTTACKTVGVGRTQFYQWLKDDEEFRKQVDDLQNVTLDMAESQLHKQILGGNTTATIFYLKTKGKKRGYIERQEITGVEGTKLFDISVVRTKENADRDTD